MSILKYVLEEEYQRCLKNINFYKTKLENLPKGSIVIQNINKGSFVYRKKRVKSKIISEYIGKLNSKESNKAIEVSKEYKRIKNNIKITTIELFKIKKALKAYSN